jgi:hypothetical protein
MQWWFQELSTGMLGENPPVATVNIPSTDVLAFCSLQQVGQETRPLGSLPFGNAGVFISQYVADGVPHEGNWPLIGGERRDEHLCHAQRERRRREGVASDPRNQRIDAVPRWPPIERTGSLRWPGLFRRCLHCPVLRATLHVLPLPAARKSDHHCSYSGLNGSPAFSRRCCSASAPNANERLSGITSAGSAGET